MMKLNLFSVLSLLLLPMAAHADLKVECKALGFKTSQGGGVLLNTQAVMKFLVAEDEDGLVIGDLRGVVKVGTTETEKLTNKNAYVGHFRFEKLNADKKYKPRKYKNYVQFKNFDAFETPGVEDGMWGSFLLSKGLGRAHYVFQAGDNMGGVVHFTCKTMR